MVDANELDILEQLYQQIDTALKQYLEELLPSEISQCLFLP